MNILYYREFNIDLYNLSDYELIYHYNNEGKNENRVYNSKSFDIIYNFNLNIYINYNNDLVFDENFLYRKHFYKNGINENRIYNNESLIAIKYNYFDLNIYIKLNDNLSYVNKEDIINHFLNFNQYINELKSINYIYYKLFNKDLENLNNYELMIHFLKYGYKEGRIYNRESFNIKYPNISFCEYIKKLKKKVNLENIINKLNINNILFYKYINKDLDHLLEKDLIIHYNNSKIENRIKNIKDFYKIYRYFDIDFYKNLYFDLKELSYYELYSHYHNYGVFENRISNIFDFNEKLSDLDIIYYKKFNPELKFKSDNDYYIYYCNYNSSSYFKYDYKVLNYNKSINNNNPLFMSIKDVTYYRKISNLNELIKYNNKFKKKYYIYNKESFYKYYNDFDYEYYKNRYFNNINKSELDILSYYHFEGKYKKEIINNKYKIIIYTPPFDIKCGGIVVLHYLAKMINDLNHPKFYVKLFLYNNLRYENIFCNDFVNDINEINDNTVVIYPETVSGNPLNCKNVVRWVLLELGIEMPNDHYKNWNQNDLIYHWEPKDKLNSKILRYHWINSIFKNHNKIRDKTCYLIKKGRLIHKNIKEIHPKDSICIEDLELEEIANTFNKSTYFYCYDPKTMYIIFAIFCGCIPIIYPIENLSKIEYLKQSIFFKDNILYDKGLAYGNSVEEINYAINTINIAKDELILLLESDKITISNFIEDLLIYFKI